MQANAEHQQDHADFGKLPGQFYIRNKPRRTGADDDPGNQIAKQRRHPEARCDETENHRQTESGCNGCDQTDIVRHSVNL